MSKETTKLSGMTADELTIQLTEVMYELKRKAYGEGYGQGKADAKFDAQMDAVSGVVNGLQHDQSDDIKYWAHIKAQERRDEIVERAKADIGELIPKDIAYEGNCYEVLHGRTEMVCKAELIVNKEKRTTVILMKGWVTGEIYAKGIAKCAPDDCFNAHIGKAIALRRALGLVVPDEYLFAPQPTEVRVGDVVVTTNEDYPRWGNGIVVRIEKPCKYRGYFVEDETYSYLTEARITDDSREEVTE